MRFRLNRDEIRGALALREVVVLAAALGMCLTVLAFTATRHRALTRIDVCRQNLYAISVAGMTYGGQNRDDWPIGAHLEATGELAGNVEYVRAIGSYRGRAGDPQAGDTGRMEQPPTSLSTTRNLWTLFRLGLITRDKFVCPGTKDVANQEPNAKDYWDFGEGDIDGSATPEQSRIGYSQISYGYQVPYGKHARPSWDLWLCWLVADKGPYGAGFETESTPLPPALPPGSPPRSWSPWNSPNHGGEGQNALHVQTHVEFLETPDVSDNIYTQFVAPPAGSARTGQIFGYGNPPAPGARLVPAPRQQRNDTLIYP